MPVTRVPSPQADPPTPAQAPSFSQLLRARTRDLHQQAEGSGFMSALLDGRVDRAGYTAMVAQHLYIYEALEAVGASLHADPIAGAFVSDRLTRVPSIRADLAYLSGSAAGDMPPPLEATLGYVERIRATATWPAGFVAHHYTRYLGDLSGGLAIGAAAARVYGFQPGGDGVRFYRFERITKPKVFKDDYRARLDAAPWDPAERERVVDEVLTAYRHNTEVFAELARVCPPSH